MLPGQSVGVLRQSLIKVSSVRGMKIYIALGDIAGISKVNLIVPGIRLCK